MSIVGSIKVDIEPVEEILRRKGLDLTGDVQQHHTQNVLGRIVKYMPYRTGATIKLTKIQSPVSKPYINTFTRYARYLHEGKVMVNAATGKGPALIPGVGYRYRKGTILKATDRDLNYTKPVDGKGHGNPLAGPRWGERLVEAESDAMLQDLKDYVRGRWDT